MGKLQRRIFTLIQRIITPHPTITNPEDRYRSRLLNSLLLIYTPLAISIVVFRQVTIPENSATTNIITIIGLAIVGLIYVIGRTGHYRISMYITIVLGYAIIYLNAITSTPPHFEIAYLIFLPLLGIVIFSMREALLNYALTIVVLFVFLITTEGMEKEVATDLFVFMLLAQGFILFANYQRKHLDRNRHQLALEKERTILTKQLIDNISHDFKTPLSIIQTSIYLMRRVDTPEKKDLGLIRIENQALRLDSMVHDLLTISQLDYDIPSEFVDIDLGELIDLVQQQLLPIALSKQIILKKQIDASTYNVSGIRDELERMVVNLVDNALNYTPEEGSVVISLSTHSVDCLCLKVSDNGLGISENDRKHIFERFYRADQARSTHTGGTGLGLAIVQRIVERHKGMIQVDSELERGTTFSIYLPVHSK